MANIPEHNEDQREDETSTGELDTSMSSLAFNEGTGTFEVFGGDAAGDADAPTKHLASDA